MHINYTPTTNGNLPEIHAPPKYTSGYVSCGNDNDDHDAPLHK